METNVCMLGAMSTPPVEKWEVVKADAFEFLMDQPAESIDLAVLDPPYESLEKHRQRGTTTRLKHSKASSNDWFGVIPNTRLPALMDLLYHVAKKDTHCYVFCDHETLLHLAPAGKAAGWKFWKPLVWHKLGGIGMGYHYRGQYEFIAFFEKGKRKLSSLSVTDVLSFRRVFRKYPAEKPVDLLKILVEQSSQEGELVMDPFMGSGSTGVAALELGRRFSGCDISPKSIEVATARFQDM